MNLIISAKSILQKKKTDFYKIGKGKQYFVTHHTEIKKQDFGLKESQKPNTTVVMLIPARTDRISFHEYIYRKAEIRFIKGRLRFGDGKNVAPFPSMVVIFKKERRENG